MYGFDTGPTVFGHMLTIPAPMAAEWPDEPVHLRMRDVIVQKEWFLMVEALERELSNAGNTHSRATHYHRCRHAAAQVPRTLWQPIAI